MRKAVKFLSSMRLTIALLAIIVVVSILATLIPQGQSDAFYVHTYGDTVGSLIVDLHLYNFYMTPFFLVPAALFFLNLLVCTIKRLVVRVRNRAPKRFGPDIIHISLLLIMVLGVYSLFTRQEAMVFLAKGDGVELENGLEIQLQKFETLSYPDGRPKDWISHIKVFLRDDELGEYAIEVNKPYSYGPYKVFQSSYRDKAVVIAEDPGGNEQKLERGDYLSRNGTALFFSHHSGKGEESSLHFIEKDDSTERELVLKQGEVWKGYRIEELLVSSYSGLQIVKMPATVPIMLSLLLLCLGLAITFYQKLGEKKK